MTNEEQILNFVEIEPALSDEEYENQKANIAKALKVRKGDIEDLMALTGTSSYSSKEFDRALSRYQHYAPDFIKNS